MTVEVQLVDDPAPEIARIIGAALTRFNDERLGAPDRRRTVAVTLGDPATGGIVGGLWGWTIRGYLYVDLLFVPERLRGEGLGRELLRLAEGEALRRGCHAVWLSTYSFQAPRFYQALGFRVVGELPDHPPGHRSIFLAKRLAGPPDANEPP